MYASLLFFTALPLLTTASPTQHALKEDEPTPNWPETFSVSFVEKTFGFGLWKTTRGNYTYDFTQKATLIERADARGDRYCASLFRGKTPCNHLVTGGTRWLVFPNQNYCCQCCTNAGGCGILTPKWVEGAEYLGTETCPTTEGMKGDSDGKDGSGKSCYKFNQPGLQPNYVWSEVDTSIPRRLFQVPNDDQFFEPESYSEAKVSAEVFSVPDFCYNKHEPVQCPKYSVCGFIA